MSTVDIFVFTYFFNALVVGVRDLLSVGRSDLFRPSRGWLRTKDCCARRHVQDYFVSRQPKAPKETERRQMPTLRMAIGLCPLLLATTAHVDKVG